MGTMRGRIIAVLAGGALPLYAAAQTMPPSYGLDFVTIGAAGNSAANQQEAPRLFPPFQQTPRLVGAVNYEYRITRMEVTVGQWFEFVQAYKPYYTGPANSSAFSSDWIHWNGSNYVMNPIAGKFPANMSWRMAARYVNWLHNGKALNQAAFENGAYDTSTFTQNPNGSYNDQSVHSPGAQFWIASEDEWAKAAYYDPNRYGKGKDGYWRQPGARQEPFVSGVPQKGGETNAGVPWIIYGNGPYMNVDAYPDSKSPWGLLDLSGGRWEFTETWNSAAHIGRQRHGSWWASGVGSYGDQDAIDRYGGIVPIESSGGFRIVSIVPAPGGVGVFMVVFALVSGTKRHEYPFSSRSRAGPADGVPLPR
ncbi:MAG: SUMF1/EgtB/PvdO family nonheme iron enzyme [Phycisphaerales bacterium]|nr:SUMF1/EgtB/PvdO family nonheme iron enzyme [Phycisphaerales bacterium]